MPSPSPSSPADRPSSGSQPHYFTNDGAAAKERTISVELAGRSLRLTTANAIFSPGGVDKGTAVLLEHAPFGPDARGHENGSDDQAHSEPVQSDTRQPETVLDLGCGWGPILITAGLSLPAARLYGVDVNERSLDLTRRNAQTAGLSAEVRLPEEIPADLRFDRIYSNPPIRVGKEVLHGMLRQWLPRLKPAGTAWLVVQKNLGADSLLSWMQQEFADLECARLSTHKGFRILTAHRPA